MRGGLAIRPNQPDHLGAASLGVRDVFGVPGDYSFGVSDAIAINTTFGVGELSAISGIAVAFAEHLSAFHLVGTPDTTTQRTRALMHHTLGIGDYYAYARMAEPVVCAQAVMTKENVVVETWMIDSKL